MKVLIEKWTVKDANDQNVERSLYLESDEMQFMLRKYSGKVSVDKKTGKESDQFDTLGYFTNVQSALLRILRMKLMKSSADTVEEMLIDIKRIEHEIKIKFSVELKDGERVAI